MRVAFAYVGSEVLGIEYLSAILKGHGHDVRLFYDPSLFDDRAIFTIPALHRLFDVKGRLVEKLVDFQPDLVAFSVLTNTFQWSLSVARLIRSRVRAPIVFGGVHPTVVPEAVIRQDAVDMVNIGEGFESFLELAGRLERGEDVRGIRNVWVKGGDGTVFRSEVREAFRDLDALPHPDKGIFAEYFDVGAAYLTITGLGCPYHCTFCSNDVYLAMYRDRGGYLRRRSVAHVIDELTAARKRYRIRVVKFADDIFTLNLRWLEEFAREYRQRVGLPYMALSHPSHINEKSARLLRESGCHRLEFGVQSVNEETKRLILDRPESKEQMERAFLLCEQHGIRYMVNHMFGIPTESEPQQLEAARFYARLRPDRVGSYYLKYLPGTRINQVAVEHGLVTPADVERFQDGYFATVHTYEHLDRRLLKVFKSFETFNVLMPLLPRRANEWLAGLRLLCALHRVPAFVRTVLDFLGGILHRDYDTRLFAKYYMSSLLRVLLVKLRLRRY